MEKIIVIKIGSSILMTKRNKLDEFRIGHIAQQVKQLQNEGFGVILVVSGAVATGFESIRFEQNEANLKQLAAGIGQVVLTSTFQKIFLSQKLQLAQLLLNQENLVIESDRESMRNLLLNYLSLNFMPFINENDVISLNSFGGNDLLASEIASLIHADKLLILSTYDRSFFGVGGGSSKVKALEIMESRKIEARILDGKNKNSILEAAL